MKRFVLFLCLVCVVLAAASAPAFADVAGERRYNFVTKKYEFYDGTDWYNFELGVPLGACTNEAETEYSTLLGMFQYCNGTNWIRMVGTPTLSFCSQAGMMDYFSNSYYYCNGLVWVNMNGLLVI
jgi:hypothetical protein